ncbi:alpha/beta-hydrolase [Daedaleopsis nitida]|nr:alpha/beta-hydrolase [Daedaleopsis nitida]
MFSSARLVAFLELAIALALGTVVASPAILRGDAPNVQLDHATVVGVTNNSVTSFTGIPFAEPPLGDLRLRLPKPLTSYNGTIDATKPATQCTQLLPPIRTDMPAEMQQLMNAYVAGSAEGTDGAQSEDCLTINVQVPEGAKPGDKLPVIAVSGFTSGSTSQMTGDAVVQRSIELNQPVIFAAMNYRINVFGFLGGKEVKETGVGNLGLHNQCEGLQWINKHIEAFGGDPAKVTLWGPSSGAISTALQMVTNGGDTEGLFRGAIMNAGSPIPTGDITYQQPYYDTIVEHTGCANTTDTLDCLRHVPADTLAAAAGTIPNLLEYPGLASPWAPRADGVFLEAPPQHLVLAGSVSKVPILTGMPVLSTTDAEFLDYLHQFYFPRAPKALVSPLLQLYPNDPAQGSPFDTGDANQLAPMYKRMSAFEGDMIFQAPRRFFLDHLSSEQLTWSFISRRGSVPGLGAAHGSNFIPALTMADELTDYIIQFTATQDPNSGSNRTISWPTYDTSTRKVLSILEDGIQIGNDTARLKAMAALSALSVAYPL